ncbi:hypothetical protein BV372_32130 [Nostoc sp. T09]|uniref:hypothetical protein n=1 Tax=Nostoc sp. T09 TaxID=1932621 RepID=UPI000A3A8AFF|nr:hypothetical protein [Nostoc sp. T09]OUL21201.1 hypothetical protein BV372_32130 [Nostoc sp. T09]
MNHGKKPPHKHSSASWKWLARGWQGGLDELRKWNEQQLENEKRAVANARFPWLAVAGLFVMYLLTGALLTIATSVWAWGWMLWILAIGLSLLLNTAALGEWTFVDDLLVDSFFLSLIVGSLWTAIALPWHKTVEGLDAIFRRWIFSVFQTNYLSDILRQLVPLYCFIILVFIEVLGLWLGYQVASL